MSHYDYFRYAAYGIFIAVFMVAGLLASLASLAERIRSAGIGTRRSRKAQGALGNSSVIIIRDNGVTVYDSTETAEASMAWADVERNPRRLAFDAKGVEFAFKRRGADGASAPAAALWKRMDSEGVELEATSVIPHPARFREALIQWLAGKEVAVEDGIALEALILLASRTRYGRPAASHEDADHGGSSLRHAHASEAARIAARRDPHPDAESNQDEPTRSAAISASTVDSGYDENVAIRAVIVIRDNGVTVYDSKEKAEDSMTWADVVRNPNRRAFDVRGIELRFQRHEYCQDDFLKSSFWRKVVHAGKWADEYPNDVRLVAISSQPQPEKLRELLVHWLDGKGVKVDGEVELGTLIARASGLRSWH
jgi:hypothetical protein